MLSRDCKHDHGDIRTEGHQKREELPGLAGSHQAWAAKAGLATGQPVPAPSPYRSVTVPTCLCRGEDK